MAELTRSSVFAAVEETTEGTYTEETAASFIPLRDGFSVQGQVETIDSDEMYDSIGKSKSFVTKEAPVGSLPKYLRHSGIEGTEPEYGIMIESAMGAKVVNSTEYNTIAGSTPGGAAAAATVVVDSGEGVNYVIGQAVVVKSGADSNGNYAVRNVTGIATDTLSLSYNITSAPGVGVDLGKAIHYSPASTGHPTYTAHHFQAGSSAAFHQSITGCRTTGMSFSFPANGFAECSFDFAGKQAFFNPITINATNDDLDFDDDGVTEVTASMEQKTYQNPHELAREIESKMDVLTTDNITVSYSDVDGKFTIASDGSTLNLLWLTGTNTATSIDSTIGFTTADDTGAITYEADNALTYEPVATPSYDTSENIVLKASELLIGDFENNICVKATECSFTINTPKTDVESLCAVNGIDSTVILEREATFSGTLILQEHNAEYFDKMINNTTTQLSFTCGEKTAGNWDVGTVVNLFLETCTITATPIADSGGFIVVNLEAKAHVDGDSNDVHINFL